MSTCMFTKVHPSAPLPPLILTQFLFRLPSPHVHRHSTHGFAQNFDKNSSLNPSPIPF